MPDTRLPHDAPLCPPQDWQQALSALPLETPPPGGWERLVPRLQPRRSTARYWVPAALAASLALLMLVPWSAREPASPTTPVVATTSPAKPDISSPVTPAGTPSQALPSGQHDRAASSAPDTRTATAAPKSDARDSTALPTKRPQSKKPKPVKSSAEPPPLVNQAPMLAASDTPAAPATDRAVAADAAPTLESLYAESARLEALLAQIRDDRVSSGTAMALSAELHDRVTGIDAALSQADLSSDARERLWRDRVATLQRLAGVETTQRWMSANGYRADGQIAQVY